MVLSHNEWVKFPLKKGGIKPISKGITHLKQERALKIIELHSIKSQEQQLI